MFNYNNILYTQVITHTFNNPIKYYFNYIYFILECQNKFLRTIRYRVEF